MAKKRMGLGLAVDLNLLLLLSLLWSPVVRAVASDCNGLVDLAAQIQCAITEGLEYLEEQYATGGFPAYGDDGIATTGLFCLKLLDRARELGQDPFNPDDPGLFPYSGDLVDAIDYLGLQLEKGDPMELRAMPSTESRRTYTTSIASMCFSSTNAPTRRVVTGEGEMSYLEVVLGLIKWLNNNQQKANQCAQGGWRYSEREGDWDWADNSISGYATMALGFAAADPPLGFGISIPSETLDKLDGFIDRVQAKSGQYKGASGYGGKWPWSPPCTFSNEIFNTLKTGNLLYELGLVGEREGDTRVDDALDFIESKWNVEGGGGGNSVTGSWSSGAGWKKDEQAMFTTMKGLEALSIDTLPNGTNWFNDVAEHLVTAQNGDGSWNGGQGYGTAPIRTCWALLTLEKAVPELAPPPSLACQDLERDANETCQACVDPEDFIVQVLNLPDGISESDFDWGADESCPYSLGETFVDVTGTYTDPGTGEVTTVTCTAKITVKDNDPPTFTDIPEDKFCVECDESTEPEETGEPTATDNCDQGPYITYTDSEPEGCCDNEKIITRTWTVEDDSGNVASFDQTITVVDTTPPTLTAPADVTVALDDLCEASTDPTYTGDASATDNCALDVTITHVDTDIPGCSAHTIARVWSATDNCGNGSPPSVQVITVQDVTPPSVPTNPPSYCIWPPNHKYVEFPSFSTNGDFIGDSTDNCADSVLVKYVDCTSSQPDNNGGDGNTNQDCFYSGDSLFARAERQGGDKAGRVYTVQYKLKDDEGNAAPATATIWVPHRVKDLKKASS